MTDFLSPVPIGQPLHFAWTFSVAPYQVVFKWDNPNSSPSVAEVTSTWTNGAASGGPPTVVSDSTTTFHVDLVLTQTPGPAFWRVQALDIGGVSLAVDEGIINVAPSPLRN